jgi:acyl carrier protein
MLPEYMVPAFFTILNEFPLTQSGKVDRHALPSIGTVTKSEKTAYCPAQRPIEKVLVEIWQRVFKFDRIGIDDHFFELGGNSLTVTQIILRAGDALDIDLTLADLFDNPTIRGLSDVIEQRLAEIDKTSVGDGADASVLKAGSFDARGLLRVQNNE